MPEDIGTIINKGFSTWTRNLKICIPFILNLMVGALVAGLAFIIFIAIFVVPMVSGTNLDPQTLSPEQTMEIFSSLFDESLWIVVVFLFVLVLLLTFIESYFTAGAIGMAENALKIGDTSIGDMFRSGNQNAFNMFLVSILISLITLVGIVFLVPGFFAIDDLDMFLNDPAGMTQSAVLLILGMLLWGIYIVVLSIIFAMVKYALVVDRLDPMSALESGFRFFMSNKVDVILIWLVLISISIILSFVGTLFDSVEALAAIWAVINLVISIVVIPPLTTIWWTRLYLDRTGKEFYDHNELLMYP